MEDMPLTACAMLFLALYGDRTWFGFVVEVVEVVVVLVLLDVGVEEEEEAVDVGCAGLVLLG